MANVDNPNGFRFVKMQSGGGSPEIVKVLAADSQTIAAGDAVIYSSGQMAIALSNSGQIAGVAVKAATSSTSNTTVYVEFIPANPLYVFEGQCSGTFSQSIIGTAVDIEGTTGIMEINEDATTEKVAMVVDYVKRSDNAVGANTRVLFTWARSSYTGLEDAE